jgi:hypothetical protein
MNENVSPLPRKAPVEIEGKMLAWRHWGVIWSMIQWLVGFSSAVLSGLLAANAKATPPGFLSQDQAFTTAAVAGGLAFLLTSLGAGKKGSQFEKASRYLEAAISRYQTDNALDVKWLGDKEAEALNKYLSG